MNGLSDEQAYAAMFYFIERIYEHTKSDDLGGLLGSMSVLEDGAPADAAVASDWLEAVNFARAGGKPSSLALR
jgi:hypothetical protein